MKFGVPFGFGVLAPEAGLFFGGDRFSLSLPSKFRRLPRARTCLCGLVLFRFYLLLDSHATSGTQTTQMSSEAI